MALIACVVDMARMCGIGGPLREVRLPRYETPQVFSSLLSRPSGERLSMPPPHHPSCSCTRAVSEVAGLLAAVAEDHKKLQWVTAANLRRLATERLGPPSMCVCVHTGKHAWLHAWMHA